ncbi:putative reverse transcriptase domain-containing protein [Tanacetum coccineum]
MKGSRRRHLEDAFRTRYGHMNSKYFDYSRTSNDARNRAFLKIILELLKKEELYAKFSKCEFWIPKVQFLGHVIDNKGIHVDPAKIESVKDWASPKTPRNSSVFSAPILALPEGSEDFIVYCDASKRVWAAVLMQREKDKTMVQSWLSDYDCDYSLSPRKANVLLIAFEQERNGKPPLRVRSFSHDYLS